MIDAPRTATSSASAPACTATMLPTLRRLHRRASGSTVRPYSPTNASSQRRAPVQSCRGHITRQRGQSRSFVQANDMPKRNLERDPQEIRFTGVVMTNEGSVLVRITRQVKQEFFRGVKISIRISRRTRREKVVYHRVASIRKSARRCK